jgi:stress response protein SCP2
VQLVPGQNAPLVGGSLTVSVTGPVDLTALVLGADGKVSGDADMVFFNQPQAPGLTLEGSRLDIALAGLRPGAEEIALVASPEREDARFGELPAVAVTVRHGADDLTFQPSGVGTETALVLCSAYRRGGAWKLRAVGQGYANGLAGVATDYGIEVGEEPAPVTEPVAEPTPAPVPLKLGKAPIGAVDLAKKGSAVIPLTRATPGRCGSTRR